MNIQFDQYGRLRNPGIPSTRPLDDYTHIQNIRTTSTFYWWDWFNDIIINIGNFIAKSTEYILSGLTWIAIIIGAIFAISSLFQVWRENSFIAALFITAIGGVILYYVFLIIFGIIYWGVSIALVVIRFIFYNAYTFLLFIAICIGIVLYK